MAVTINPYNRHMEFALEAAMDHDGDTFKAELYNSTHTYTAANDDRADISANALASGNGYTNPGQNLSAVTVTESTGTITWDAADVTWSATPGSIGPAADTVIYDDTMTTPVADALLFSIDHDGDQTAGAGTDFKITWNASGIFTVS